MESRSVRGPPEGAAVAQRDASNTQRLLHQLVEVVEELQLAVARLLHLLVRLVGVPVHVPAREPLESRYMSVREALESRWKSPVGVPARVL